MSFHESLHHKFCESLSATTFLLFFTVATTQYAYITSGLYQRIMAISNFSKVRGIIWEREEHPRAGDLATLLS